MKFITRYKPYMEYEGSLIEVASMYGFHFPVAATLEELGAELEAFEERLSSIGLHADHLFRNVRYIPITTIEGET